MARFSELFTEDAVYDLEDFTAGTHHGIDAIRRLTMNAGERNPLGHHVTNIVVREDASGTVRVKSKGIGVRADGTTGSVVYDDVVVKTPDGWRLRHRVVLARRV